MDDPSAVVPSATRELRMRWRIFLLGGLTAMFGVVTFVWLVNTSAPQRDPNEATAPLAGRFKPYKEPRAVAPMKFRNESGRELTLADFKGKAVLLNIWATWCPPCRKEMPELDRLQATLGGPGFEVVALSIDRDGSGIVRRFYDEIHVQSLALYIDTSAEVMQQLAIVGVPTTLLIDASGREVWRHVGPETWDAPDIVDMLRGMIAPAPELAK